MKRLVPLSNTPSYVERYLRIRDSKSADVRVELESIHRPIVRQYDSYALQAASRNLEVVRRSQRCATSANALRHCYDSPTNALRALKKEIKELQPRRQLKYCPMCGVTLPKTFDHYMPAARFPEYAVMALNLIPCCSQCNSIKDDDWLSTSGERQFLHLYFDCIPEEQYLFVQLLSSADMRGVGASFELRRPSGFRRNKWSLLTSHYKRLKLLERFSEEGNEEIAEVLAGCKAHLQAGGGSASLLLQNLANDRATVYGDSHWRTVLMRALSTYSRLDQLIPLI